MTERTDACHPHTPETDPPRTPAQRGPRPVARRRTAPAVRPRLGGARRGRRTERGDEPGRRERPATRPDRPPGPVHPAPGPPGDGCPGNRSGAELVANRIGGSVEVNGTTGTGPFPEDDRAEIERNTIRGSLHCTGNTPPPTNGGNPNTVHGTRAGQCANL
ncbi:hypothetical protein [Streptomyces sp. NRRL WC-3742]|uniref:hypothetical protein n=1 Tax=Streptomyces sp. NRRL WC-3742 TaxID=1463934 RepID=UPI000ABD186E|nr:hypothetical protein [Streptomyces sp. NRRL WC-3742]